jgi:putative DNA primase/helicase
MIATEPTNEILDRLHGVKQHGERWEARCPAHDDKHASLSITKGEDGRTLLHCHAGCGPIQIVQALGLRLASLFPPKEKRNRRRVTESPDRIVAEYSYIDAAGTLLYQVVRFEPKDFRQRQPNGEGGWIWNMDGVERVLYRLPELMRASPENRVFIVEGEKDVDSLAALGLVATCNPGGAGKWSKLADTSVLNGRRIVIIPDADDPGKRHAWEVASALQGKAAEVKTVNLPGAKDVSDWIKAGGTAAELGHMADAAPAHDSKAEPPPPAAEDGHVLDRTDLGNSVRLVKAISGKRMYDRSSGWLAYDGRRWADGESAVREDGKQVVLSIKKEAVRESSPELQQELWKHAFMSQSSARIEAMIGLARTDPLIETRASDFDKDPWLLNVANGTLDLRTGTLRPHSQADMMRRITPVEYHQGAVAPRWQMFLARIMGGNVNLVQWLQKAVGYSLTGLTSEQCFAFLYGVGRNGKSVFCGVLQELMGEYGAKVSAETLLGVRRSGGEASADVARLAGLRLVVASELPEGGRLNEALVKDLTGGDVITARHLYKAPFDFRPAFKLWLYGNHKPVVRGTDEGIWRRVRMVPFTQTIPETEVDPRLPEKLREELPGILAWAVEGCRLWQADRLGFTEEIRQATADLRSESDLLGSFLADHCMIGENLSAPAGELYATYRRWAEDSNEQPVTQKQFGSALAERGFEDSKGTHGVRYRRGLALREYTN